MDVARDVIIILFVADQIRSRDFYKTMLETEPHLDVEGMTEIKINEYCTLGLMPEHGIARLLEDAMPNPAEANGIPRCELYLMVDNPNICFDRALKEGAKMLSAPVLRNWGDIVGYVADPDGHIIAFAKKNENTK